MSEIAGVGAQPIQQVEVKNPPKKKEVVYVSSNPDRAANAAGVVAGTAGMTGGAVLGGMVGLVKIPGKLTSTVAGRDYAAIVRDPFNTFKATVKSNPQIVELIDALRYAKDSNNTEGILECLSTLSQRVTQALEHDEAAKGVINKTLDPILDSCTIWRNMGSVEGTLFRKIFEAVLPRKFCNKADSPWGRTIRKFFGLNIKSSEIIAGATGNVAEGLLNAYENVKAFTPEEKEAWSRVCDQIGIELESNPAMKVSKSTVKTLKSLITDPEWLSKPFKTMQETIIKGAKRFDKDLTNMVLKTVGLHSAIGAAACGAVSILGWLGIKKSILRKEEQKLNEVQ